MKEKQICCCGVSGWTKVIGWAQLICSTVLLFTEGFDLTWRILILQGHVTRPAAGETFNKLTYNILVRFLLFILVYIVAMVMSVDLLRGTYNGTTKKIETWIIYTRILAFLWFAGRMMILMEPDVDKNVECLGVTVGMIIIGFSYWVVHSHKKELEAKAVAVVFPKAP